MIDKRTNPYNIELNIHFPCNDNEIIEEFKEEIRKITNNCIGQAQNSNTIFQLERDLENLLQNEKYEGITITNNEFYIEELWSLEKLLDVYHREYPDRLTDKKEYTNIDVNNMLFDLKLCGVIGGYLSPAVCADIPSHNNKIFSGDPIPVEVPIINLGG